MSEQNKIEDLLSKEMLSNEKIRLTFLTAIALIVLVMFALVTAFDWPGNVVLNNYEPVYYFAAILILVIIREIVILYVVLPKISKKKKRLNFLKYVNLVFEISIPTALMAVFLSYYNNIFVLNTPAVSIYFLIIILTILNLEFKISLYAGLLAASQYLIVVYFAVKNSNVDPASNPAAHFNFYIGRAVALVIAGILTGYIGYLLKQKINNSLKTIEESNKIREIFGQQISNEIVTELLDKKNKIETEKKFVTIMFVDIRGFTPFAESRQPDEIIEYQNQVFGFMTDYIIKHNGVINQFLGDGFMATFGAPISKGNDSQNSINASLEILAELKRKNDSKEIPFTRIGIGLHSGDVVTGNVGSKNRQQYSISGNTVIIAARIEQLTKEYISQLLISSELRENLTACSDQFDLVGPVKIKGREKPVEIYKWNKEN